MQRLGVVAGTICTTAFEPMARRECEALGRPKLPLLFITHPLGGLPPEEVVLRVREAAEQLAGMMRSEREASSWS